jgi:hypothetical protein
VKEMYYVVIGFALLMILTINKPINGKLENIYAEGIGQC